jgi:WD40 repeat protein
MIKLLANYIAAFLLTTCLQVVANDAIHSGSLIAIPQLGHTGTIFSVAVSSDGRYALSGGDDTSIKLWNLETGHEIRTFRGHTGNVVDIVISNDSKWAASIANNDYSVRLWDLDTGKSLGVLNHKRSIQSIALSPDERFLLTGGDTLILWNLGTSKIEQEFNITAVASVAFSANGKHVVTGGDNGSVMLWDIDSGNLLKTFRHKKAVSAVAFRPTKDQIISGSFDHTINLWDINSGGLIKSLNNESAVQDLSVSSDGRYIVSGSSGVRDKTSGSKIKQLRIWDFENFSNITLPRSDQEHTAPKIGRVYAVAFISDTNKIISGGRNKLLAIWDVKSKEEPYSLQQHASTEAFISNLGNSNFISISNYKQLSYWNIETAKIVNSIEVMDETGLTDNSGYQIIDFLTSTSTFIDNKNHGNSLIAVGGDNGTTIIFKDGSQIASISEHKAAVSSIAFSAQGNQLITGSFDFTAKLWNIKHSINGIKFKKNHSFSHTNQIVAVSFSSDGKTVLTSGVDQLIVLWDALTGKEIKRWDLSYDDLGLSSLYVMIDYSNAVPFESKTEKYIYLLANGLRRINTETKQMELLQTGFEPGEYSIAISPDGQYIIIGKKLPTDSEGSLFIYNTSNNQQHINFSHFNSPVLSVQFANQGKLVLASSLGGIHYFNLDSQIKIGVLSGSMDGESIFVTDDNYFTNTDEGDKEVILRPEIGKQTFSFNQVAKILKKPNIVQARINGEMSKGRPSPLITTPPILRIVNEQPIINASDQIELHIKSINDNPLHNISVYINARSMQG